MRFVGKGALVFVVAVGAIGCDRGCVSGERGDGAHRGRAMGGALFGTDCSGGLLRCVGGRVEASRAAHLPHPCGASVQSERPGACVCPWDEVARCRSGCVDDGLEIAASPDAGAEQLCLPLTPSARPLLPGDAIPEDICASEEVSCADGVVRVCDGPGLPVRAIARCLAGCQSGVSVAHGEPASLDGLVSILCRRDQAERR